MMPEGQGDIYNMKSGSGGMNIIRTIMHYQTAGIAKDDPDSKNQLEQITKQLAALEKKAPSLSRTTQQNILENLRSFNHCHLSSEYTAPFAIKEKGHCEEMGHVMSFSNGKTLKIEEYVKAALVGDREAAKSAVIETTPQIFNRFAKDRSDSKDPGNEM